jgi:hypothetical protein
MITTIGYALGAAFTLCVVARTSVQNRRPIRGYRPARRGVTPTYRAGWHVR